MRISNDGAADEVNCILMDSQSYLYDRSGLYFTDCSLMVEGCETSKSSTDKTSTNLIINAGKMHAIRNNVSTAYGCLVYGNCEYNTYEDKDFCNASLSMYGGYMKTEKGTEYKKDTIAFKCFQPRGKGAKINMIYGDIESHHYCISGQGTHEFGYSEYELFGGTEINITGGTLVGGLEPEDEKYIYTPLFFPQSGTVNIEGSKIIAPYSSCLNAKRGTIKINNGTFIAYGNDDSQVATLSGSSADGSVLFLECTSIYMGSSINLTINGGTMLSRYRSIVRFAGYETAEETKYADVTINGGNFTYKSDTHFIVDNEIKSGNYSYTENGGNWTQL